MRRAVFLCLWMGAAPALGEGEVPPPAPPAAPAEAEVLARIERMGSARFAEREEAFRDLSAWARRDERTRGILAEQAKRQADLEVRERSRMILEETQYDYAEFRLGRPGLAEKLREGEEAAVVEALRELPPAPEAVPLVRGVLEAHLEWGSRGLLVEILGRIPTPESVEVLLSCLRNAQDPARDDAAEVLGKLRAPQAEEPFLSIARDRSDPLRARACLALASLASRRAAPVFRGILKAEDPGEDALRASVLALAWVGDAEDVPDLARLALRAEEGRSDPAVRALAVEALERLPDPRSTSALVEIVSRAGEEPALRRQACLALGSQQAAEAIGPLHDCLRDASAPLSVRKGAVAALRKITGAFLAGTVEEQVVFYGERIQR